MKNYIFGYGSLIEKSSRQQTTPKAEIAYPVKVKGFKRGWFARTGVIGFSTTFLGCIYDKESYVNGVIYEVSEQELKLTDNRELGYKRIQIKQDSLELFVDSSLLNKEICIWIYISPFLKNEIPVSRLPSSEFPLIQSYIDICLNGCLEIEDLYPKAKEENFAIQFIQLTDYWSTHWVNDRIYPRRPTQYVPRAYMIDSLLNEHLPDKTLFNKIALA